MGIIDLPMPYPKTRMAVLNLQNVQGAGTREMRNAMSKLEQPAPPLGLRIIAPQAPDGFSDRASPIPERVHAAGSKMSTQGSTGCPQPLNVEPIRKAARRPGPGGASNGTNGGNL